MSNNLPNLQEKFLKILSDKNLSHVDFFKIIDKYFAIKEGEQQFNFLEDILENATDEELLKLDADYQDFPHKLLS